MTFCCAAHVVCAVLAVLVVYLWCVLRTRLRENECLHTEILSCTDHVHQLAKDIQLAKDMRDIREFELEVSEQHRHNITQELQRLNDRWCDSEDNTDSDASSVQSLSVEVE